MISGSGQLDFAVGGPETVRLDGFTADAIRAESDRTGVSVQELTCFSVLYYLADVDSGRIARNLARSPSRVGGTGPAS